MAPRRSKSDEQRLARRGGSQLSKQRSLHHTFLILSSMFVGLLALFLFSGFAPWSSAAQCDSDLLVETGTFSIHGSVARNSSHVRQFLGIPYAEPPVGEHRFRPPVTKRPYRATLNATSYGPVCMQYDNGAPSVYNQLLHGYNVGVGMSEDCLTLNIWTPRTLKSDAQLPVLFWIPGGALLNGGSAVPYTDGSSIVGAHQDVIVVSINYRVNIFGFPAAAALDGRHHNVGLLDQRKAVEWVYENIWAFGGNASRITLFGQSAGASSTDFFSYAWFYDPLVSGFIIQSGAVGNSQITYSSGTSNFSFVAEQVGCGSNDKDEQFKCMQGKDASEILKVYETYNATLHEGRSLGFGASVDEETIFSNWTDRRARGLIARKPTLIGTTDNDYASLYSPYDGSAPNQTAVDELTDSYFNCRAAIASQ